MPFHGVLPHRQHLFQPEPLHDIGVNDTHAWRLNPTHRHVRQTAIGTGAKFTGCGV